MEKNSTIIGLDVHKNTIVAAVLPPGAERAREVVTIDNDPQAVARLGQRLAGQGRLEFVYEAGPCGYEVHRQLTALGYTCAVIAPALIPVRPGDRVKTDRRDAGKLALFYRAGVLTAIRVPTCVEEAARDLVRAREAAVVDRLRVRHRLVKFLLRQGRVYRETKAWGVAHRAWLLTQQFPWPALQLTFTAHLRAVEETEARLATLDQAVGDLAHHPSYRALVDALRCLKGIQTLSALTLAVEAQDFRRFPDAPAFMAYTGLVGSERSSAERIRRGGITRTGNAHLRRVLVEAAWSQRHRNVVNPALAARRHAGPPAIVALARKAQTRLHRKFWRLLKGSKPAQVAAVAVARELAGFVWAIGQQVPQPG